jgi:hypothetical protein
VAVAVESRSPGATTDELRRRLRVEYSLLRAILAEEERLGRIERGPDGRWRICAWAFEPGVLATLRAIREPWD